MDMETKVGWFRRMAMRLRSLLDHPSYPVTLSESLDLIAMLGGKKSWAEVTAFSLDDSVVMNAARFGCLAQAIHDRFHITLDDADLIQLLLTRGDPVPGKIRKRGPFTIARLTKDYPAFAQFMEVAVQRIQELPDFSDDKKIMAMTDFSGDHATALNHTYSFVFFSADKIGPFERAVRALREKHGYSEIAYKKLESGPRKRALPEFLDLVDQFVHGAVITIAVDKDIPTLFGITKHEAHATIIRQLEEAGLGIWTDKGPLAERTMRICYALAIMASLLLSNGQRFLWYCDNDPINEDGNERNFQTIQEIFRQSWNVFATQALELLGFAKSFPEKTYLDDMLSVADLAAGAVQDLLQAREDGKEIPGREAKLRVVKWLVTRTQFLSKIHIHLTKLPNNEVGVEVVSFQATEELLNYPFDSGNSTGTTQIGAP